MFTRDRQHRFTAALFIVVALISGGWVASHPGSAAKAAPGDTAVLSHHIYISSIRRDPVPKAVPTSGPIYLGMYLWPDWANYNNDMQKMESTIGKSHAIYHYFIDWPHADDWPFQQHLLDTIVNNGSTAMLTWMSIPASGGDFAGCGDSSWNLDSIIGGRHDDYIRRFATSVRNWGHPLLLRWGHEMNLRSYSWSGYCNGADGNAPAKFIKAYQHIHDLFRQQGASNVKWVWSPNAGSDPVVAWNDLNNYYPGDAYVDWIGLVGYNWGRSRSESNHRWMSFNDIFGGYIRDMGARHPNKPVMIADFASVEDDGGDKGEWVRSAFAAMLTYPNLHAAVWYNGLPSETYFAVTSSPDALDAYRKGISSSPIFSSSALKP